MKNKRHRCTRLASSGGSASGLRVGKEYEVQGRFATLEAIEGDEAVCRDRFDNRFKVSIGDVVEKQNKGI